MASVLAGLLAAGLCVIDLSSRSLWLDEGTSVAIASQHGAALWRGIAHDGGNMLAFYLGLHLIIGVLGDGVVAIRVISVVAQGLTAALATHLALRLWGDRVTAVLAGVLCGLSVSLLYWGQDARGYAALVTFVTASFLALVNMLEAAPGSRRGRVAALGYGLTLTLALYVGYDAVLIVPAQLLVAGLAGRRVGTLLRCLLVVAVLCVPLVWLAIERGTGQLFWVPPIGPGVLLQTLVTVVSAGAPPSIHIGWMTVLATIVLGAGTVRAMVTLWRGSERAGGRIARTATDGGGPADPRVSVALTRLPVLWVGVPGLLALLASLAGEPVELARVSLLLIPGVALVLAWSLRMLRRRRAVTVGAALVLGLRLAVLVPAYGESAEPWQQVTTRLLAEARPGDCVAFYPEDGQELVGYYLRLRRDAAAAPRLILPAQSWAVSRPHVEQYRVLDPASATRRSAGCRRVWLIAAHQGQPQGTTQSRRDWAGYLATRHALATRYRAHWVTTLGWAAPISVTRYSRARDG